MAEGKGRQGIEGAGDPATEAADWLVRQRDPLFDDWDIFTDWIEADAAHAAHYRRLAALDAAVAEDVRLDPPPREDRIGALRAWPPRRRSMMIAAACFAMIAIAAPLVLWPDSRYEVVTAAGHRKHIELADGSRIILNERTRMRFDRAAPRTASLDAGEALFDIVHDPKTRFRVRFDGGTVENLGTRFTVKRKGMATEVAVAEGAVAYRAGGHRAELRPGHRLVAAGGRPIMGPVAIDRVGAWATPRLVYKNAPLSVVGADLSRELGVPVAVTPAAANMRVTASIQLDLDVGQSMTRLAPLLGVKILRRSDGWLIAPTR